MGSNNKQGMIWEVASPLLLLLGCSSVDLLVLMVFGPPDTGTNKGRLYQTTTRCAVFWKCREEEEEYDGSGAWEKEVGGKRRRKNNTNERTPVTNTEREEQGRQVYAMHRRLLVVSCCVTGSRVGTSPIKQSRANETTAEEEEESGFILPQQQQQQIR